VKCRWLWRRGEWQGAGAGCGGRGVLGLEGGVRGESRLRRMLGRRTGSVVVVREEVRGGISWFNIRLE
jgi:hypothetical protein